MSSKAHIFKADLATLQGEVEDDPSKAKGLAKHVAGITPSVVGTLTDSKPLLQPHVASFYQETESLFPVGLTSRSGGCVVVTKAKDGKGHSLHFMTTIAVVYPDSNEDSKKAHALMGLSDANSLTRGGEPLTFDELQENTYFSTVKYPNAINRFRLTNIPAVRQFEAALNKEHKDSFRMSKTVLPAKVRSDPDDFLLKEANATLGSGTFFPAALPVYFPLLAGGDFAFLSEIPLPTSISDGNFSDQKRAWKSFTDTLVEAGCPKDSPLLEDSFFQLWVKAVVASPSIFEGTMSTCPFQGMATRAEQNAAIQTMFKVIVDNIWSHDLEGKEDDANVLFGVIHMQESPFTDDDWSDEYEVMGTIYTIEKQWWLDHYRQLPKPTLLEHQPDVTMVSPDRVSSKNKKAASSSSKRSPRALISKIAPNQNPQTSKSPASASKNDKSDEESDDGDLGTTPTPEKIKSLFSEDFERKLSALYGCSLRLGDNHDTHIHRADLANAWEAFDTHTQETVPILDKRFMLPGKLTDRWRRRGPDSLNVHAQFLGMNLNSYVKQAVPDKSRLFSDEAFGLFLKGKLSFSSLLGSQKFTGYTPLMSLLLLPYCDMEVHDKVAHPLMPADGFKNFVDIMVFLEAVRVTLRNLFAYEHNKKMMPLLLYCFDTLMDKLKNSKLGQFWDFPHIDKCMISFQIMRMVHDLFADAAFLGEVTEPHRYEIIHRGRVSCLEHQQPMIPSVYHTGDTTVDLYKSVDEFNQRMATLFADFEKSLEDKDYGREVVHQPVKHFIFKSTQTGSKRKQQQVDDSITKKAKMTAAIAGRAVIRLKPGVNKEEVKGRFGPKKSEPKGNPLAPRGGKGRGKYTKLTLCVRYLLGHDCDWDGIPGCGYHLAVTRDSIKGEAQDYEGFRSWCKEFCHLVEPTPVALANPILFPKGRL
ncbi:predicted protein [Chaetoceros tenuissimus]|uniref:Uncharacterized protein n=1 Tax=Chaetoceros tenuissimus TaxID=426638 RepID=A0AAD3D430_9STRA|nr:predicted protein [Chaetoceros tenuissimus]